MKCAICEMTIDSVEEAVEQKWIPFFYEGDEPHGPACSGCSQELLSEVLGEMEVRTQYRGKIVYHDQLSPAYRRRKRRRQ